MAKSQRPVVMDKLSSSGHLDVKVIFVSTTFSFILVIDTCPSSTPLVVSLYQIKKNSFNLFFNVVFSICVLLHCVTLGIVAKCHPLS
jgi:hypothetical protein